MVEMAETRGLKAMAFTDHGPELEVGIARGKMPAMLQDIRLAREEADIPVLAGMEANVADGTGRIDVDGPILESLDIVVVGIHTLEEAATPRDFAENYLKRATLAVDNDQVDVLAHPFFLQEPLLPHLPLEDVKEFLRLAGDRGVAMEVNAKYKCPGADFISLCLQEGVKLSVGSDAHSVADVGRVDWPLAELGRAGVKREDLILTKFVR
jgi:histidinol phosphatase-like PHP family hydrolase